ncbi:MAG: agmatinase [Flavobacteriaceae bacterium]|jgi:agmatinase|nr:agmatinase [Flavobacteriaceae bacterium]
MKTNKTYAGIAKKFSKIESAKIVLIPVCYDGTSTWQKGADKGPSAFLEASENMELYDIETNSEVYKKGIYLSDSISDFDSPDEMIDTVYKITKKYISKNKFVTIFGGEHSISIATVKAFNDSFDDLSVLHIDAHADLRQVYEGTKYNHACAMYEANQNTNLVQVGIRSMDVEEKNVMNQDNVFFAHELASNEYWIDDVIEKLSKNVFISFDLDAFDPSILPSTGTPEPGGLFWYETLDFLRRVFNEKNVVGFDIVELCPNEIDKSSDFLAAKLYYKMLSYKFKSNENDNEYNEEEKIDSPFKKLIKFKNDYE